MKAALKSARSITRIELSRRDPPRLPVSRSDAIDHGGKNGQMIGQKTAEGGGLRTEIPHQTSGNLPSCGK